MCFCVAHFLPTVAEFWWGGCAGHQAGHTEAVQALVDCCADFNACRDNGDTAVLLAARAGKPETVLELVRLGADIHESQSADGKPVSRIAIAARGHIGVLRALAKLGVASAASALAEAATAAAAMPKEHEGVQPTTAAAAMPTEESVESQERTRPTKKTKTGGGGKEDEGKRNNSGGSCGSAEGGGSMNT